ncbi:FemAB family XrtA/PEP-CTERM system-associated protein [Sphingomonas solaris]|uniref:FemAB family PEP-CTERM system-associated protein n=1 Tax=Alterirhizorhabdus solaris TaxID=2529389 RepID=A0A558R9V3_9SPHN|nr:FemAB family XrtA/PEP-CTERM system-associated protein [Sphingomonas solaris]TVV76161.1 FemAB family PEP-CTERM system-associated protein [Sphingomonas solaris]
MAPMRAGVRADGVTIAAVDPVRDGGAVEAWVRARADATPFHLPAWSAAVARGCGQPAHYLVARSGGAIAGVLPLSAIHSPLFGRALVSSGFAVGGGILAGDDGVAAALAEAAWALAGRLSTPSLELRGGWLPEGDGWHISRESYAGFTRPLAADDDAELLAIPRKQRAEVRRALGFPLTVEIGRGERDRAAHYAVYAASVRNLGTPVFPRALFEAMLDALGDEADILTIRHEGRPVASVLSLYFGGCVMPYWGGGTTEARTWRANDLMYFALMRHARARGCTTFDFGRSKPGTGAFAFKRNWGFVPAPLAYATRTADGVAPRVVNPLDPKYSLQVAAWRRLPLWLANRLGPMIARGLG